MEDIKDKIELTKDRYGFQWNLLNAGFHVNLSEEFDEISPFIKKDDFAQKIVLDVGCGTGKVTDIAAKSGARLAVGIDISPSVQAAKKNNLNNINAFILQADLNRLPFNIDFDIITALGVLHHTPDPRASFLNLIRYLKPGGKIEVLIYAKENIRLIKMMIDLFRKLVYRRNNRLRYSIAYVTNVVSSFILWLYYWIARIFFQSKIKGNKNYFLYLYRKGFIYRQQVFLDNLSTPIIHFFTQEEIKKWFQDAGFVNFNIKCRNNNTWIAYGEKEL